MGSIPVKALHPFKLLIDLLSKEDRHRIPHRQPNIHLFIHLHPHFLSNSPSSIRSSRAWTDRPQTTVYTISTTIPQTACVQNDNRTHRLIESGCKIDVAAKNRGIESSITENRDTIMGSTVSKKSGSL